MTCCGRWLLDAYLSASYPKAPSILVGRHDVRYVLLDSITLIPSRKVCTINLLRKSVRAIGYASLTNPAISVSTWPRLLAIKFLGRTIPVLNSLEMFSSQLPNYFEVAISGLLYSINLIFLSKSSFCICICNVQMEFFELSWTFWNWILSYFFFFTCIHLFH